jgi:hypothetical protein
VHLEDLDRVALEVAERRVPGAEVVDREPDAELAQLAQAAHGLVGILDERALGQLEHEPLGRKPVLGHDLGDLPTNRRSWSWRAETLTLSVSGPTDGQRRAHSTPCRQASRAPSARSGTIRPISSASGMKSTAG